MLLDQHSPDMPGGCAAVWSKSSFGVSPSPRGIEFWLPTRQILRQFNEFFKTHRDAVALALLAGVLTVVVTRRVANRQIAASREEADRVIAATREQTRATFKQTETAVDLEQMRNASEALAFHAMLEAAMARVLAEAAWARETHPNILKQADGASVDALAVRQCITKGAFAELAPLASGGAAL